MPIQTVAFVAICILHLISWIYPLKIGSKASRFRGKSNKIIHCSNPLLSMEEVAVNCHRSTVN